MSQQQLNNIPIPLSSKRSKSLNIYCQPCLKRGLINKPAYVNLNEFQSNRYICESCSVGQTYIILLGKDFFNDKDKEVKLENKLKIVTGEHEKQDLKQNISAQKPHEADVQNQNQLQKDSINLTELVPQNEYRQQSQDQGQLPEFVKNIQINSNPESKYSIADIDMYTENITHQYKQAMEVINKYQEMIKLHIKKWRNKLKAQFQGVIGTFGNATVCMFLKQLKQMEDMEKDIKILEETMRQERQNGTNQKTEELSQQTQIINNKTQAKNFLLKNDIKSQQNIKPTLSQLYTQSLNAYKIQQEKITLYVQSLKMSGIRNLSNLKSLYNCCKGFSDAVKILISLQHKETNRRFDFISQKFKVCSIETLYDAEMINGGYLDNRLEKPPGFDVIGEQTDKKISQCFNVRKVMKEDFYERKKFESPLLKEAPSLNFKKVQNLPTKQIVDQSQKQTQKQKLKPLPHEISLISSQSQHEQSIIQQSQKQASQLNQLQILSQIKQGQEKFDPKMKKSLKQEMMNDKILLQKQDDLQRIKIAKMRSKRPFQSRLLNLNMMEREDANQILRQEKQKQNFLKQGSQTGNQIDLQNYNSETGKKDETQTSFQNPNSPFPALRQFYQYQKGQNSFVSKLQLTQQNFQTFPPNNIYMPSVESLTIRYCPPVTDPLQLLKTLKSCFKKLNQLIIEEPRLGTKQMIIMIAEIFPKLKSLVFRCKNEFDWQLGKLFEKKMGQLVRFEVNDGEKS